MTDFAQIRMTAAEFKRLPESSEHIELIYGEIVVSPTPKDPHQSIVGSSHLLLHQLSPGGRIVLSPMDVYLDDENVLQPDVFWVSGPESKCRLGEDGYWHGAPDLIIEILSPSTALRDKTEKFDLYERFGSREYWLIDPEAQYVEVWRLNKDKFVRVGIFGHQDQFESADLGKTVQLAGLFKD